MAKVRLVPAKLGNMRKAENFIVYPESKTRETGRLLVQSDHRIADIDPATGEGVLSVYRKNGAYFIHLNPILGAMPITVPLDVVAAFQAAQPNSGDEIGPGVRVA